MKTKTKKRSTDLFVRELEPVQRDAEAYKKIAHGEGLHTYASFLEANTYDKALERIQNAKRSINETMYGLFNKANRLVAVFLVHDTCIEGEPERQATVHYFVAESFQRRGYCVRGLEILADMLCDVFDSFIFEIRKKNIASIRVQESLGSVVEGEAKNFIFFKYLLAS